MSELPTNSDSTTPQSREKKRAAIVKAAKIGMPWKMIARLVNMTLSDLNDFRHCEKDLACDVLQAQARCMNHLLKQLNAAKQWQAITFILESRWPDHFGRNRKKKRKNLLEPDPSDEMLEALTPEEFTQFRAALDKMHAAKKAKSRKKSRRQICSPEEPLRLCGPGVEGT